MLNFKYEASFYKQPLVTFHCRTKMDIMQCVKQKSSNQIFAVEFFCYKVFFLFFRITYFLFLFYSNCLFFFIVGYCWFCTHINKLQGFVCISVQFLYFLSSYYDSSIDANKVKVKINVVCPKVQTVPYKQFVFCLCSVVFFCGHFSL